MVADLSDARQRVADWPLPDTDGPPALAGGFAAVYRRGRRAYAAAAADPHPERLHELRKRAKDLWHASQLLAAVCPKPMKKLQQEAHRLSDLLGEHHDLTILAECAERQPELLGDRQLELLQALIAHRRDAVSGEALATAAALYRSKPKKLLARLSLE